MIEEYSDEDYQKHAAEAGKHYLQLLLFYNNVFMMTIMMIILMMMKVFTMIMKMMMILPFYPYNKRLSVH